MDPELQLLWESKKIVRKAEEEKAYKLAYDEQLCTNFPLMRLVIDIGQNENGVSSLPADRRLALEEVSIFLENNN
jgi:hypothetical protein